jgi:2-oxopent-4-enoate/cis-2-oxohex-4-enoate hydratase
MPIAKELLTSLANSLYQAQLDAQPIAALTDTQPELSLLDAYAISSLNLRRRTEAKGVHLIGKKIGLTSRAVQKQLGVSEPDFGYLTSDMNIPSGEKVGQSLILPRVEGEVAFMLKKDLIGPGVTAAQVITATEYVLPCIEIIDSRVKDWKIKIQDTVADNASSALFVLGTTPRSLGRADLGMAGMLLKKNGEVESTGVGMACLDHPVNAVAWLANKLGEFGVPLKAGEIILSGAYGPVVPVVKGDYCEVEINGLGIVSCSF